MDTRLSESRQFALLSEPSSGRALRPRAPPSRRRARPPSPSPSPKSLVRRSQRLRHRSLSPPSSPPSTTPLSGLTSGVTALSLSPRNSSDAGDLAEIGEENVHFGGILAKGNFGYVFKGKWERRAVAIKVLPRELPRSIDAGTFAEDEVLKMLETEIAIYSRVSSEWLPEYYGKLKTERGPAIVMRLYDGDLEALIAARLGTGRGGGLGEREFVRYTYHMCRALMDLHAAQVICRDLKPKNVLYDKKKDKCLLTDMGLARIVSGQGSVHTGQGGTVYYTCQPDSVEERFTFKTDMWTLAQTCHHMWTGHAPKTNPARLRRDMPLWEVLDSCLEIAPGRRPSAVEVGRVVERSYPQYLG